MSTFTNTAREVEMPNGDVVVIHNAPTGGENTTSNIKKFKYDDNGHVTESTAADAEDLNLSSYSTPTTGTTAIGTSDDVQTAIGKLDHQSHIDQTNILYALDKVGTNCASIDNLSFTAVGEIRNAVISIGNSLTGNIHIHLDSITSDDTNSSTCAYILYYTDGSASNTLQFNRGVTIDLDIDLGNKILKTVDIYPSNNYSHSEADTFTLTNFMVTSKAIWDQFPTFTPAARQNYDLTRLESEDRTSLAEVVDSGAKNELQPSWTTQEINGVKFTVGSDGVITATTTGTRTSAAIYPLLSRYSGTKMTGKVMSISPKGGTNASYYVAAEQADSPWHNVGTDYGDGVVISSEANNKDINVNIVIPANYSPNNLKFSPMLCTKAAFCLSNKFVPYRPNYDLVGSAVSALNSSVFSPVTSVFVGGSIAFTGITGGYIRIGNLVVVNVRCTAATNIPVDTAMLAGLPRPLLTQSLTAACVTNNLNYFISLLGMGNEARISNGSTGEIKSGTSLILSCVYIAD